MHMVNVAVLDSEPHRPPPAGNFPALGALTIESIGLMTGEPLSFSLSFFFGDIFVSFILRSRMFLVWGFSDLAPPSHYTRWPCQAYSTPHRNAPVFSRLFRVGLKLTFNSPSIRLSCVLGCEAGCGVSEKGEGGGCEGNLRPRFMWVSVDATRDVHTAVDDPVRLLLSEPQIYFFPFFHLFLFFFLSLPRRKVNSFG
ncbi:hypothetical protein HOY80DRAFT_11393 [Tuber brumale]|nr:hypothetical protein HOY80DRAFT_11393 [Tuber brumale]